MAFQYIRWQEFPARRKEISWEDILLLSFLQLKCSSNIDSIHYLGLTNSFDRKLINFLLLLNEPIRFRFRTD
jgi:hypothetical protein